MAYGRRVVSARVSEQQGAIIDAAAALEGRTLAHWIADVLIRQAHAVVRERTAELAPEQGPAR